MPEIAYLFERFPSFGQTFCYREVAELERQGTKVQVYSIRRPVDEPKQDWDEQIVRRVHYLPEEAALVREVEPRLIVEWDGFAKAVRVGDPVFLARLVVIDGVDRHHRHRPGQEE